MDFRFADSTYFTYDVLLLASVIYHVIRPLLSHRPHTDGRW